MAWDLYSEQPLLLIHPAELKIAVAAVSKIDGGIVWWNADYLISQNMPDGDHTGGSGFAYYPIRGVPEFIEEKDSWRISPADDPLRVYVFTKPTPEMLRLWEDYKQYVPSIEELAKMALELTRGD